MDERDWKHLDNALEKGGFVCVVQKTVLLSVMARLNEAGQTEAADALTIRALQEENVRLKSGNFTEEEFQNLCHNLKVEENPITVADVCRFVAGCDDYQKRLFGDVLVKQALAIMEEKDE